MICFCYFCKQIVFQLGVILADTFVVEIGPQKAIFSGFTKFLSTTRLQQKLLILIESPNIFHWKST